MPELTLKTTQGAYDIEIDYQFYHDYQRQTPDCPEVDDIIIGEVDEVRLVPTDGGQPIVLTADGITEDFLSWLEDGGIDLWGEMEQWASDNNFPGDYY